jgi:arylformamidase
MKKLSGASWGVNPPFGGPARADRAAQMCYKTFTGEAMHRIIDVTLPLSADTPGYPGDPPFCLEPFHRMDQGAPYNVSRLVTGTHAGTHVDAPAHFVAGGRSVDQLPLEILVGKTRVIELSAVDRIERRDLERADLRDDLRVLLKTRVSQRPREGAAHEDAVPLSADAASYLVQAGLKLVGLDCLSVDAPDSKDFAAHRALLQAGVIVIEGLDLAAVEPGDYDMTCLPLRLVGADGSPARVFLRERPLSGAAGPKEKPQAARRP